MTQRDYVELMAKCAAYMFTLDFVIYCIYLLIN